VIRVNSAKGRTKTRNMQQGSPVALSIMDPDNAYRYVQVRGKVTRVTEEGASAHIDSLAKKYIGQDKYRVVAARGSKGDIRDHADRRADDGLK
jgi:Pyridoxamine 5'-phosphate oxidase